MSADPRPVERCALVVAAGGYRDPALRPLRSPGHDALALAGVLGDPGVGGFTVRTTVDPTERELRVAVGETLRDRGQDDVVLVYLSAHGLVGDRRELHLAAVDTWKARLAATAVSSQWLTAQLDACRARRQIVILDCCFSGGFAGASDAERDLRLDLLFADRGRGRTVLTSSRVTEYSLEGEPLAPGAVAPSIFTAALVEGIVSGAADRDGDRMISVDDAFEYASRALRERGAPQRPTRWVFGGDGPVLLARVPHRPEPARPTPTPAPRPARLPPPPAPTALVRPGRAWALLGLVVAVVVLVIAVDIVVSLARMG